MFKDLHPHLNDPINVRLLRDIADTFETSSRRFVIVSPVQRIPVEVEKDIALVEYPLPARDQFGAMLESVIKHFKSSVAVTITLDSNDRERLLTAASGLTLDEAKRALTKYIAASNCLDGKAVSAMLRESWLPKIGR